MKHKLKYYLCVAALFLASSCSLWRNEVVLNVNSLGTKYSSGHEMKYFIVPGNKEIKEGDLEFKEYKNLVDKMLKNLGYQQAKSQKESAIIIFLYYGISAPQQDFYKYSAPTYGRTGISTYYGYGGYNTFGVTGYTSQVGVDVSYIKFMVLSAMKNDKKLNQEVWKVAVESSGSNNDLRSIFPFLVVASESYIGRDSKEKVKIKIPEEDVRVKNIKSQI